MAEKVSVVIPNWNGARWLPLCLDSLQRQTFRDFKVYVVDNGSTDGSVELIKSGYPNITIIENEENLGFAGGINCGFRAAAGELIVALNNDVETDPDWLAVMVGTMDAHPHAGSGASQLMDFRDRDVVDSLGDGFLPIGISIKAWSGARYPLQGLEVQEIQSPCAAASVYRKAMLDRIGLFDEDFFAYMEDIDLGLRAQMAGYRCIFIPGAVVYHIGSATSGGTASAFSIHQTVANTYRVILKNVPLPLLPIYVTLTLSTHLFALAASAIPGKLDWVAQNRRSVGRGLINAVRAIPNSLKKRHKMQHLRTQTTSNFIEVTRGTWSFKPSKMQQPTKASLRNPT
ncbi:glycosyltransferase family 2 protein [Marivita sp.]|uniref:glycosyltransferase family 2 protein n=1 Tax=Marivita sp. TaxID=2003365 RepID=UPI0025BB8404|nr:glycosyltransferase family 2 protein [Marivita sp.]